MQTKTSDNSMRLLTSRVLPSPDGDADQRWAWEVLRRAAICGRVCLLTPSPKRMHLSQWRQLNEYAEHVELVPRGWFGFDRQWKRSLTSLLQRYPDAQIHSAESTRAAREQNAILTLPSTSPGSLKRAA